MTIPIPSADELINELLYRIGQLKVELSKSANRILALESQLARKGEAREIAIKAQGYPCGRQPTEYEGD